MAEQMFQAKKEIPLEVRKKELNSEETYKRVENAYVQALGSFKEAARKEAENYSTSRVANSHADMSNWAKEIQKAPSYLSLEWNIGWEISGKGYEKYENMLKKASTDRDPIAIGKIIDQARKKGVEVSVTLTSNASLDYKFINSLSEKKGDFVSGVMGVIEDRTGEGQPLKKAFSIDIGNEKAARIFANELQGQIGASKPPSLKLGQSVPLEKALADSSIMQKGHYPFEVKREGATISVDWASWIEAKAEEPGRKLGAVPRKAL